MAAERVREITAAFAAAYSATPIVELRMPVVDALLMMTPCPCFSICASSYFMHRKTPRTFVSKTGSNSCSSCSASGATDPNHPALLNATSRRPNVSTAASISARTAVGRVTSVGTNNAVPPIARIAATVASPASRSRLPTTTRAPCLPNASAVARPIPEPPPVMSTTRSSNMIDFLRRYAVMFAIRRPVQATVHDTTRADARFGRKPPCPPRVEG